MANDDPKQPWNIPSLVGGSQPKPEPEPEPEPEAKPATPSWQVPAGFQAPRPVASPSSAPKGTLIGVVPQSAFGRPGNPLNQPPQSPLNQPPRGPFGQAQQNPLNRLPQSPLNQPP
ncbi:MAG: hypothetical protein KC486_32505, partial [Myxococcales bacterium]|nr:hypothetical protein [Myxococcales bacterium]